MTPVARIAAAIEILDEILAGESAERTLTTWARGNRYAGSKDRAAIRDYVFDAIRCQRSFAFLGGFDHSNTAARPTGRQLMIGSCRSADLPLDDIFCEARFAPNPLEEHEAEIKEISKAPRAIQLNCPDWILPLYEQALGDKCDDILIKTQQRSEVFLRVNLRKATVEQAQDVLKTDEIETEPCALSPTALKVLTRPRTVSRSQAYLDGIVELQDAGSQAIIDALPLTEGLNILDYCAGGGGKSLAMASSADMSITASDLDPNRMQDIAHRAERAGVTITAVPQNEITATYDLVLCDVPCSGSGSWARAPQAKWQLDQERLDELVSIQAQILEDVVQYVNVGGILAYATCSLFDMENKSQIERFLDKNPNFILEDERLMTPLDGGDGFFVAVLKRRV